MTSLQFAIQSGIPEAVSVLLDGMTDDAQRVAQLTRRYGGTSTGDMDDDGLFDGTNPILHAALVFNSDIFGLILTAMNRFLAPRQVSEWYNIYILIEGGLFGALKPERSFVDP